MLEVENKQRNSTIHAIGVREKETQNKTKFKILNIFKKNILETREYLNFTHGKFLMCSWKN
jgi:hypothetical protein